MSELNAYQLTLEAEEAEKKLRAIEARLKTKIRKDGKLHGLFSVQLAREYFLNPDLTSSALPHPELTIQQHLQCYDAVIENFKLTRSWKK